MKEGAEKEKTETGEFTEKGSPKNDCHVTRTTPNLHTNLISSSRRFSTVLLHSTTKRCTSGLCESDSIGITSKQYTWSVIVSLQKRNCNYNNHIILRLSLLKILWKKFIIMLAYSRSYFSQAVNGMIRGADGAWKWKNCFKSSLMKRKTMGVVHNNLKKNGGLPDGCFSCIGSPKWENAASNSDFRFVDQCSLALSSVKLNQESVSVKPQSEFGLRPFLFYYLCTTMLNCG